MKSILLYGVMFSLVAIFSPSCVKEYSCEGCNDSNKPPNRPPVAIAGRDQTLTLPLNSASLDGSASADPERTIMSYLWTKVSGPSSFSITDLSAARTQLTGLRQGVYLFELKVSDAGGLYSKDTVQIHVVAASVDTTFTDLVWIRWHPENLPVSDSMWDEIYLHTETRENLFLNVPDSNIRVYVKTEPGTDWIECYGLINDTCESPFEFRHGNSYISVFACPNDFSLVGKKASLRVVIK